MSDTAEIRQRKISRVFLDIVVIVFCISGTAASLYLFFQDLYATFRLSDIYKVGVVTDQSRTIRRRPSSKKVWERLFIDSPVYNGDYVRNDDQFSSAVLDIDGNKVRLGENTFIRVMKDMGQLNIEQIEGSANISVTSGKNSETIFLVLKNQTVEILPETEVNAVSGDDGMVRLNFTGSGAKVISEGQVRNVSSGDVIIQDSNGGEVLKPVASVIQPKPNAQLIKSGAAPLNVEFKWVRINLRQQDILRLEIAADRNFTRLIHSVDNPDSGAVVSLNTVGFIFWRILFEGLELSSGRVNITEAAPPALLAPAGPTAQIPVKKTAGQEIQFRWAEVPNAMYYILQISELQDFINPEIEIPVQVASYISSDIDIGTWYWRVKPVFSNDYEGAVGFSQISSFQVEAALQPAATAASAAPATPAAILGENVSGTNTEDTNTYGINDTVGSVSSGIADKEESDEDLFLALREQTKQVWQEQQAQLQQLSQTQISQANSVLQGTDQVSSALRGADIVSSVSQTQQQARQETQQQVRQDTQTQPQTRQEIQAQQQTQQTLRLISPAQNMDIAGLTALREPTIFRWDTNEDIVLSRFVLSRRENPLSGRPEIDINNPGRTVSIPVLAEGVWYWTVEGRTRDGRQVTAAPRQIRVQAAPLLPVPQNRLPGAGSIIGAEELRQKKNIVFSWSRVSGANSYVLTIFKDGFPGKQQIFQSEPTEELTYTLEDFYMFEESGIFYWQVEAIFNNDAGRLEQRGIPGENSFMLDVPRPGRVRTRRVGTLYGR
jgi:glucan-binding YG repeat protein